MKKLLSVLLIWAMSLTVFTACGQQTIQITDSDSFQYQKNTAKATESQNLNIDFSVLEIDTSKVASSDTLTIGGYYDGIIYYYTSNVNGDIKIFSYSEISGKTSLIRDMGECDFEIELYITSDGIYILYTTLDANESAQQHIEFADYSSLAFRDITDSLINTDTVVRFTDGYISYIGADTDQTLYCYDVSASTRKEFIPENGISAGNIPVIANGSAYCLTFDSDRYYINRFSLSSDDNDVYLVPEEIKVTSFAVGEKYMLINTATDGITYTYVLDPVGGKITELTSSDLQALSYFFYTDSQVVIRDKTGLLLYDIETNTYKDLTSLLGFAENEVNTYFIASHDGMIVRSFDDSKLVFIKTK